MRNVPRGHQYSSACDHGNGDYNVGTDSESLILTSPSPFPSTVTAITTTAEYEGRSNQLGLVQNNVEYHLNPPCLTKSVEGHVDGFQVFAQREVHFATPLAPISILLIYLIHAMCLLKIILSSFGEFI